MNDASKAVRVTSRELTEEILVPVESTPRNGFAFWRGTKEPPSTLVYLVRRAAIIVEQAKARPPPKRSSGRLRTWARPSRKQSDG